MTYLSTTGDLAMTILEMDRQLNELANSPVLFIDTRTAAKHAAELLRAFRSAQKLDWNSGAEALYGIAQNTSKGDQA